MPGSLAYVFWHWPKAEASVEAYESKIISFLSSLNSHKPSGFVEALSFRVESLPWSPAHNLYEDWYVVEDFGDLGALNDAAVSGESKAPHDTIAKDYLKGAGGVYRCIMGSLNLKDSIYATWVEKPIGPSYQSYYDQVSSFLGKMPSDLWRRQLVLGPSPQFCIHSEEPIQVPDTLKPLAIKLKRLTP